MSRTAISVSGARTARPAAPAGSEGLLAATRTLIDRFLKAGARDRAQLVVIAYQQSLVRVR